MLPWVRNVRLAAAIPMLVLLLSCLLGACGAPQQSVDASAIDDLVQSVSARHDAYVREDKSLSADDKATYLRSTDILKRIMDTAMGRTAPAPIEPEPVSTAPSWFDEVENGIVRPPRPGCGSPVDTC